MNRTLKHFAERILLETGVATLARARLRRQTLVLAYHNIVPDGEAPAGELSLHLPQREFARQLDALADACDVVSITELGATPQAGQQARRHAPARRPRVVITFDDAYAGALSCGVDELVKRGMPATVFVAPELLGSVTWWDVLAQQTGGAIPEQVRMEALHGRGGNTRAVLDGQALGSPNARTSVKLPSIGTESQLSAAAARPGITIGSHTWSHWNLASLDYTALEAELVRSREWLESRFERAVPWLTYPYGICTYLVREAVERAGYRGAFLIDGGWMRSASYRRYAIPRLNVPAGISVNGFRLRLAGL